MDMLEAWNGLKNIKQLVTLKMNRTHLPFGQIGY
jgi:hypothetical protein